MTQKSRQVIPPLAVTVLILAQQRVPDWCLERLQRRRQRLLQDNVRTVQIASRAGLAGCGQLMTMSHWEEGPRSSWKLVEGGLLTLGCVRERPANGGLDKGRGFLGWTRLRMLCVDLAGFFLAASFAFSLPGDIGFRVN